MTTEEILQKQFDFELAKMIIRYNGKIEFPIILLKILKICSEMTITIARANEMNPDDTQDIYDSTVQSFKEMISDCDEAVRIKFKKTT